MAYGKQNNLIGHNESTRFTVVGIAIVSAVYFADICLKASQKCFWFDELFTVYLCRLSSFKDTWTAVMQGSDFNPPLFYLLTRFAQRLFGEGLIATRLPAIFGVWLFCICLFLFVAKRAGPISGFIAGTFPLFTLAQYYAYEARAHGIVLGWCGLALLCWQENKQGRGRYLWLAAFGLSLTGALLTHVYAVYLFVPFALVEVYDLLSRHRADWGIVAVMALVLTSVILAVYLPLFRIYRATMGFSFANPAHDVVQHFLINVFGPATVIFLLWLLLYVVEGMRRRPGPDTPPSIPRREMILAAGFGCIPFLGWAGCRLSHGPFFDRYFLSSVAGCAIFIGFAVAGRQAGSWAARVLAGCMFLFMLGDLGATIFLTVHHRMVLDEPTGWGARVITTPNAPMELYSTLLTNPEGLDILVLGGQEYLYLFYNAPPSVVPHLYFGAPKDDLFLNAYERLAKATHIDLKTTTVAPFLATHKRFLAYEVSSKTSRVFVQNAVGIIAKAGYRLTSAQGDALGVLYEYTQ